MRRALLCVALLTGWSTPAQALSGPDCGLAQEWCQCAALFSILETDDGDAAFVARLRDRAQVLRENTYSYLGQAAGDQQVDGWVTDYRALGENVDGALELAKAISLCEPYLGVQSSRVLVMP